MWLQPKQGRKQGLPRGSLLPAIPAPRRAQRGLLATGYRRSQARAGQRNTTGRKREAEPRASRNFQEMIDPETRLAAFFRSWGGKCGA
jgi:hypothetical protein